MEDDLNLFEKEDVLIFLKIEDDLKKNNSTKNN